MDTPGGTMLSDADISLRSTLRRTLRAQRQALSPEQQRQASARLAKHLRQNLNIHKARRIGLYLAADGELDPLPGLQGLRQRHSRWCLPALSRTHRQQLEFVPWQPGDPLYPNLYGIGEPDLRQHKPLPLWSLDLLLMPLVAFDANGNRLGMGGGFYDRTLANLRGKAGKPLLIGVAHRFQQVESLPAAAWDWPLDGIVTD